MDTLPPSGTDLSRLTVTLALALGEGVRRRPGWLHWRCPGPAPAAVIENRLAGAVCLLLRAALESDCPRLLLCTHTCGSFVQLVGCGQFAPLPLAVLRLYSCRIDGFLLQSPGSVGLCLPAAATARPLRRTTADYLLDRYSPLRQLLGDYLLAEE